MVFGVFLLELRAVVIVETRVVVDNFWTWFWEGTEEGFCEPTRDFGNGGGHTARNVVLAIWMSQYQ